MLSLNDWKFCEPLQGIKCSTTQISFDVRKVQRKFINPKLKLCP